jgi:hypothetical protein
MSSLDNEQPRLYGVLSHAIDSIWQQVIPYLSKALDYADDKYTLEDIYKFLKEREMQLWLMYVNGVMHGCCITQIIIFPHHKRLAIPFVSGIQMYKWLHLFDVIVEFAKTNGCTSIEGYARPGWEKVLKKYGFKKIYSIIKADI